MISQLSHERPVIAADNAVVRDDMGTERTCEDECVVGGRSDPFYRFEWYFCFVIFGAFDERLFDNFKSMFANHSFVLPVCIVIDDLFFYSVSHEWQTDEKKHATRD